MIELDQLKWQVFEITKQCPQCTSDEWIARLLHPHSKPNYWKYTCKTCKTMWRKPQEIDVPIV
jgi:transposase-like protein